MKDMRKRTADWILNKGVSFDNLAITIEVVKTAFNPRNEFNRY